MGKASWTDGVEFRTVNGGITLDLPPSLSAEVRAETVNGEIFTDFPLTVTGKLGPRRVTGTIGGGGRQLALSTVNGNIRLRKAGERPLKGLGKAGGKQGEGDYGR